MKDRNYSTSFIVDRTPEEVFAAINDVRSWWIGDIEGETDKLGAEFSYRYQDLHYSKQKVSELIPNKKVVWDIVDASINFVNDKTEWTGTKVVFDISKKGDKTEVHFTHIGLAPKIECYNACSDAWSYYINTSLRSFITTGKSHTN